MNTQREAQTSRRGGRGARRRILDTATELFYHEGINATGVERLASEASVSKRTLYQHFPSKTAVVEEYLRAIQQGVGDPIQPGPNADKQEPRARILALFDSPPEGGTMRGCPFHNAAVEAAEAMPEVQDIVHSHKRNYINGLTKLAQQAGAANPRMLGSQLAVLYEGAAALSTSLNDRGPWAHARKAAQTLIDQAVSQS
jgi:AcrR family transcriptional regulator